MGGRPLTDADYDRLADALNQFHGEHAMNLEQLDGFFAALICGPDLVRPSEYLPEIWGGGEMADEEAFSSRQQLKDFLDLVMRHWNAIAETLQSGDSKTHWSCQGVLLTAACCSTAADAARKRSAINRMPCCCNGATVGSLW